MYNSSVYRPKHPLKVHVWAGISMEGRTAICIFEGIMNKELFVNILDLTLPWKRSREDEFNQWRREFSCVFFLRTNQLNTNKTPLLLQYPLHVSI